MIFLTMLLGLTGVILGLIIGIHPVVSEDYDLIAYVLFGFGLFTGLISVLGLIGILRRNREYIRVVSHLLTALSFLV